MGQWEDKLGAILNNPQAMDQIMALAQSLGGGQEETAQEVPMEPAAQLPPAPAQESPALDPRLMAAGMRALAAWQDPEDPRAALLQALRPLVGEARRGKVDKAIRAARLSKAIGAALRGLREEGEADV